MTQLHQRMLEELQRRNCSAETIRLDLPHIADSPHIFIALRISSEPRTFVGTNCF